MFRRKSIALRIALGYLAVIMLTGLLMGSSFWLLLNRHLEQTARENLLRDARSVADMLIDRPESGYWQRGMMHQYMTYHMLGRVIQGEYLLVNRRGVVVESSISTVPAGSVLDPAVAEQMTDAGIYEGRVTLGNERYVAAARYLSGMNGRGAAVVLLTRVEGLEEIRRELLTLFLISLGAASLAALVITVLLARRISRPLALLREKAHRVAERNFGWRVPVDTGDEIGELGQAVNAMDEKLAAYDRAQKQFFQNASHELKSPLMSIQGYAEGVRDGIFHGPEAGRALDVIVRETGRLKNLVEELVYLGKLESAFGVYKFEEIELLEVLEQAVESQRVVALERGIDLEITRCPEAHLRADGEKMVRVFINLISNALRYASSRVEVDAEAAGGGNVRVTVRDDGPGFTGEDLRHLWDRFYKGPRGGSGLGLPIARAIVQEHGGDICARNAAVGGAELEVLLPLGD
ncbi:sensor histidine kinase [Desulfoscipio geothermicus]|uniref:Signal transduction histidine-protein kinase/phosphatase MprB n=1 Tax=Desulfoscipio geothermicus DSM 3669 TaxID=1121426 RepID=A0A1I6DTZ6_9FIRM|nr:HAMP domain-containing sensor histidine kinase [Desulfoscipio geothermicus]SFR08837.1 Signal transduction histidine kinase [Desulfoscipio geothermicus DSM 3669]